MQNEVSAVMVPRPGHDRCRGAACCAPTLRSGGVTSCAPGAGSEPGSLLERPAERGLGVVPHLHPGTFNAGLSPVVEVCTLTGDPSGGAPVDCMTSGGT